MGYYHIFGDYYFAYNSLFMNDLHVDSVVKSYGDRTVLTDVYISCKCGEIVGLLGRNGSGKSTLLKIIFGSLGARSRFVMVGDRQLKGVGDGAHFIKYLPQESFLPNNIKVRTIIKMFCSDCEAQSLSEHQVIQPILNKRSSDLSGGERRLLEVMLIISSDADYILIDEPFNGMSPNCVEIIKQMIRDCSARKGFIITDHSYRNILDIATRVVLIYDGGTKDIAGESDLKTWGYIP